MALTQHCFCTRCCLKSSWQEILKDALLKFLPKTLPGETLCKFVQIFPPKVLVYIQKFFLSNFLLKITYQRELKQIKCEMKHMFIECSLQDNSFTDGSLVNNDRTTS